MAENKEAVTAIHQSDSWGEACLGLQQDHGQVPLSELVGAAAGPNVQQIQPHVCVGARSARS